MRGGIRGVLVDLSGTLHVEGTATRDAVAALARLRESGLQVRFVSNTSKESRGQLEARLSQLGFAVEPRHLVTSLSAAATLVRRRKLRPLLLVDGGAQTDFALVDAASSDADFDSVVVGLAPAKFEYESLSRAMNVLLKNPTLIALHKGRYLHRSDGLALGPGPFVAALEYATGVTAEVVGKPTRAFFQIALDDMHLAAVECVMIGDDVRDDVEGALDAGMQGVLVQTGKYRDGDETRHGITPSATVADFSEAVDLILSSS
ncbi:HAD-like domain-containing protein [Chytriomyces sp. MP71]|nr:HAD-like domain-containing protein [Chytriomyces sp. MP71]